MFLKKELTEYNRYQAFAVHMAISLVIFFILLVCITQYWYPGILFDTGNGWKAIGMIVGIDLVLGPLLTLIVFNHNKSSLKFDLAIIALVQTAALAYGTWTIHQTRPVALAFINTSFMTIFAENELGQKLIQRTKDLNTYELFYVFNESKLTSSLEVDLFEAYEEHAHSLKTLTSPYINDDLVNLDPLLSSSRFIKIHPKSGKIIKFIKK
ncbi:MAG: hypothetical protein ACJAW8_000105 [Oleispira sp.]|jgi:hypothetical protein